MDAEANGAHLGCLPERLDEGRLGLGVLELDCLDATLVVEVPRVLVVGDGLGVARLHHEVARLLVQILLKVGANDDVHGRRLADLVLVQAAILVRLEDEGPDRAQNAQFLVRHRDEVDGFGGKGVDGAQVDASAPLKHEVAELFGLRERDNSGLGLVKHGMGYLRF